MLEWEMGRRWPSLKLQLLVRNDTSHAFNCNLSCSHENTNLEVALDWPWLLINPPNDPTEGTLLIA